MHLQDTYGSEKSAVGDWNAIGYKEPTSTVFTYTGGSGSFKASTISALDGISGDWTVTSSWIADPGVVKHEPNMPTGAEKLTPNFKKIGTSNAAGL